MATLGAQGTRDYSIHPFPVCTLSYKNGYRRLSPGDHTIDDRDLVGFGEHLSDVRPALVEGLGAKDSHDRDALVRPVFRIPVVIILLVDLHVGTEDNGEQLQGIRGRSLVHGRSAGHLAAVLVSRGSQLHQRAIRASPQEDVIISVAHHRRAVHLERDCSVRVDLDLGRLFGCNQVLELGL